MPSNPSPSKVERLDVNDIDEELQKAIQSMDEIQNNLDELTEKVTQERGLLAYSSPPMIDTDVLRIQNVVGPNYRRRAPPPHTHTI